MAQISNTVRNSSGPLTKYGGDNLNMPGSTVRAPQTKGTSGVVWGIPQANNHQFPMPSFNTANSTPASAQPPAPITRSGGTPYKPSTTTPTTTNSGYVSPQSNNVSSGSSGWTDAQRSKLDEIIAGANNLQNAFNEYKNNQTTKGLVTPPKTSKTKENQSQFSQFTSGLMDASQPSKTQRDYLRKLEQQSRKGQEAANRAAQISDMYGSEIARVGKLGAGAVAGAKTTGTDVVGRGNAAIAAESASNRISALGAAQTAALQGTGQQLTAAEQGITGLTNAGNIANTQQQLAQQALQFGGQLSQPSPAAYGQTVFDPTQSGFMGGNMDPQTQANYLAQQVKTGNMTYEQATQSLGYAGGVGQQMLNQALGGGFNIPQATAQITGQSAVMQQVPALEGADNAAMGIKNRIITYLNANPQLNPNDLVVGNKLEQWIQSGQLGDPKYQTLSNYLNEYTSTLAPILGVGGDPTNLKTQIAQSFVNAAAQGQSIAEVLENIQSLSSNKIKDLKSGAYGGGVVSNPSSIGATGGYQLGAGGMADTWD